MTQNYDTKELTQALSEWIIQWTNEFISAKRQNMSFVLLVEYER